MPGTHINTLQAALPYYFAPWVRALGLKIDSFDSHSVAWRQPQNTKLSRVGGMLCGQAMMAAADTAMVLAPINHLAGSNPAPRFR